MATVLMGYKLGGLPALDWTIRGIQEDPNIISSIPYSHYYRVGGPPKLYMGFRARRVQEAIFVRTNGSQGRFCVVFVFKNAVFICQNPVACTRFDCKLETHQKTLSLFCCFSLSLSRSLLPPSLTLLPPLSLSLLYLLYVSRDW